MVSMLHGQSQLVGDKIMSLGESVSEDAHTDTASLSKPMSGQLSKYTNVMKGWQYRWFVLNPSQSTLDYFEREEHKAQKPRGSVSLQGAMVAPSDEDPVTFTIHAANGEIVRLKADCTKTRQLWVSRLMYVSQTDVRSRSGTGNNTQEMRAAARPTSTLWYDHTTGTPNRNKSRSMSSLDDSPALLEVKEYLNELVILEEQLTEKIGSLPAHNSYINSLDEDILLLKACSRATLGCLESCLYMLERQHTAAARESFNRSHLPSGAKVEWIANHQVDEGQHTFPVLLFAYDIASTQALPLFWQPKLGKLTSGTKGAAFAAASTSASSNSVMSPEHTKQFAEESEIGFTQPFNVPTINREDEVPDADVCEEQDLGEMEQHKSVILHLLSQLKLGMDLTKVVLPTFILEKRSLLEMFADCMAHPDIFLKIPDQSTPESRMLQVLEWYLTSFHEGRKGSVAKKPYNPIIGETFHCSWHVPDEEGTGRSRQLIYTAEQVSHHPPVSAFHISSPHSQISLTGSIWTKSKFMGMSIGVNLVGALTLSLPQHKEEYVMTLPSAYARSILTYPWVELGDRCKITCKRTGYQASVVFHTKPFYGGKLHRISGEVKNADGTICTKINGAWNGEIEITSAAGNTSVVDTQKLTVHRKQVRPINKQGDHESRRLWQHVTNALRHNDINTATEHKTLLENRQREEERHRKEKGVAFPTKYFHKTGDITSWVYKGSSSQKPV